MKDLFQFNESLQVRQSNSKWSGADILRAVDTIVTCHGTVGLEGACLGKPVLLVDQGWYDEADIAECAAGRKQYEQLLGEHWPTQQDLEAKKHNALLLAGIFWGKPKWQGGGSYVRGFTSVGYLQGRSPTD
jgi:hypothetical protein